MPEEKFWICTPQKLNELFRVHKQVEGIDSKNENGYIEDILF